MQQDSADMTKIKKMLDAFSLDDFGRNGLQMEAEEEIAVQNGKQAAVGSYTHKVHQLQET